LKTGAGSVSVTASLLLTRLVTLEDGRMRGFLRTCLLAELELYNEADFGGSGRGLLELTEKLLEQRLLLPKF
jgi:hypothetical protein